MTLVMAKVAASTIKLPGEGKELLAKYAEVYELADVGEAELPNILSRVNVLLCWCGGEFYAIGYVLKPPAERA